MINILVPDIAPTTNKLYAGTHWAVRKALADKWHKYIEVYCKEHDIKPVKEFPVVILSQTRMKHYHKRDASNCSYAHKLAEDGLVTAGIIPDDSPEYVSGCITWRPITKYGKHETEIIICNMNEINKVIKHFERKINDGYL